MENPTKDNRVPTGLGYYDIPCNDRDEWLKEREKGIGSSEAGTIAGINAFDTPLRLWRRKMKIDPPVEETLIMTMGHYLEPLVAETFAKETGHIMDPDSVPDFLCVDDSKPWRRVSPDRFFWPAGTAPEDRVRANAFILECKSTDKHVTPYAIPQYWFCQVQYQMAVTRTKYCYIAWLERGRGTFGYVRVDAVPAFQDVLMQSIDRFHNHNVEGGHQPAVIIDDLDAVLMFDAAEADATILADEETLKLVTEYNAYAPEVDKVTKRMDSIKTALKAYIGNKEILADDNGEVIATWKAPRDKDGNPTGSRRYIMRKRKTESGEAVTDAKGTGAKASATGYRTAPQDTAQPSDQPAPTTYSFARPVIIPRKA